MDVLNSNSIREQCMRKTILSRNDKLAYISKDFVFCIYIAVRNMFELIIAKQKSKKSCTLIQFHIIILLITSSY